MLLAELKKLDEAERERRLEQLRGLTEAPPDAGRELMDWDEIERVAASGIEIESHGATHAILTGLSTGSVVEELVSSRDALLERGLGRHGLLAYPSGAFDAQVQRAAREAGYRAAVTIEPGLADASHDPFALPRLCVHQGIVGSRAEFLTKIPGAA
jgi:peptidoglycan/xylan/chitin deacetylase (PgdA/CDA1 family)